MEFLNNTSRSQLWNLHGLRATWTFSVLCFLAVILTIAVEARSTHKLKLQNYTLQSIEPIANIKHNSYSAHDIVSANLFGRLPQKPIAVAPKPTTLDLNLDGILWASNGINSRAIITSGKKRPELYSVDQEILGTSGVSVNEIKENEVILYRNGLFESLPLVKATISGNRKIVAYSSPSHSEVRSVAPDDYEAYTKSILDAQKESEQLE